VLPLRRRLGGLDGRRVLSTHARLGAAAVLAAAVSWLVASGLHAVAGPGRTGSVLALTVGGAVMLAVYAGALRMLRVRELDDLVAPVLSRVRRRG
jgi:putative peptidoglycan lipid II flippase